MEENTPQTYVEITNGETIPDQPVTPSLFANSQFFITLLMMFGVLYLLIITPQQKQKKEHEKMLNSLKIKNKVITSSGIVGIITNIKDEKNIVVLRVDSTNNTKIEFQKSSIVAVLDSKDDDDEENSGN